MTEFISIIVAYIYPWFLSHGIKIIVIIIGAYIINKLAKKFIEKGVRILVVVDKLSSEDSETKREDTLIYIFIATFKIILLILTVLMILQELGLMIEPILAAAGIIGLAFGFGGQYLIRDIISGLFIILENQYRIGDVVQFDNVGGLVEEISMRMTTLRDLDGTVHHVPHGEIKTVSNLSKYFARVNLNIGVAYDTNLEHVIETINTTGMALAEDPIWKDSIIKAPLFLRVDDFADSSIIVKILGETKPLKQWEVTGELRKRLKIAFDKEGIEIPFPQRVIIQK
ncbi:MAG: mechanosensitive ion channel family protein [Candidatus Gracilibacteria bacterium]|nr:mechanosensitive ion channel family protein [Candidatus Gracilibacteria bacterium]MDD2908977.1 mechanosensitive ion channel family protein [Candidatus Gracilibacteria bacterium]